MKMTEFPSKVEDFEIVTQKHGQSQSIGTKIRWSGAKTSGVHTEKSILACSTPLWESQLLLERVKHMTISPFRGTKFNHRNQMQNWWQWTSLSALTKFLLLCAKCLFFCTFPFLIGRFIVKGPLFTHLLHSFWVAIPRFVCPNGWWMPMETTTPSWAG